MSLYRILGMCDARCSHAGICSLDADHEGDHQAKSGDKVLCTFTEAERVPAAIADAKWRADAPLLAAIGDILGLNEDAPQRREFLDQSAALQRESDYFREREDRG